MTKRLELLHQKFHAAEKIFSSRRVDETAEIFYRLRYVLGAIFFLLCVLLEIHGSSISIYAHLFGHPELDADLLGHFRPIRSDEYIVFTPFAFAQYFTDFNLISDIVRGTATNMFIVYGQAVHHLAMIFRPAQIGYLFLDQGSGLAFFWVSRLVILFLVSFEFAKKILNAGRRLSLLYAVMIAFSPLAQWWWAVNSIAEILAAGQGLVLFWKLYLNEQGRKRFLYAAGFLWCAGIYIFGIYPAWQVPFGWTFLMFLIAVTATSDGVLKILSRDKIFWLVGMIVMLAPLCHALYISRDMVEITRATEYPGERFDLGGGFPMMMHMIYGLSALLPFCSIDSTGIMNDSGTSTFFSAAPLGLLVFFIMIWRRQFDLMIMLLVGLSFVFAFWEAIGFPAWLAKITMLEVTIGLRMRNIIDFLQMLILFRGLSLIELKFSRAEKFFIAALISSVGLIISCNFFGDWMSAKKIFLMATFVFVAVYLFAGKLNNFRVGILILMMLTMGATVNPIAHGVDSIYEMPVGKKIAEIVTHDKSLWLVEDDGVQRNDFPIMFGAPTVNSVNVYPALDRWKKLDPNGENLPIYNRYAHITITMTDRPTEFHLNQIDYFTLRLNSADLPKLDARYILSPHGDLEKFSTAAVKIRKLYEDAGNYIYKVDY